MENNTPAEVGAENRPASKISVQAVHDAQAVAGSMTKTK